MPDTYTVGRKTFGTIQDAVIHAREQAVNSKRPLPAIPVIHNGNQTIVAVVTDDANGLMVQRLAAWPMHAECAY